MANYTIFMRCSDCSRPYYASGEYEVGQFYYCGNDGHYYFAEYYSDEPAGSEISNLSVRLLATCPPYGPIFYRCNDNSGPYCVYGTNYSGVYYYSGDGQYYRVDHYSYYPEGTELESRRLSYYGPVCPTHTIFYRCGDNSGPYYVNSINFIPGVYSYTDGQYYRVDHCSNSAEGSPLSESGLSYYGSDCPSSSYYTIFYNCRDNSGPYYDYGEYDPGVYYDFFYDQYYRVDHYSAEPEGSMLEYWYLSYYGPTCPGGPSFNPAWALYTNSYVGIGHV